MNKKFAESFVEALDLLEEEEKIDFVLEFFEDLDLTKDAESSILSTLEKFGY